MITLDLFESPEDPRPQAAYIPVSPEKPGSRNRALGNANLAILMKAINNVDANNKPAPLPARLNFLDGRSYSIDPKYYPEIIQHYRTLSDVERVNFVYRTLTSYNKTIKFLNTLAQGTLFEKTDADKSVKDKYKDAVVQRAVTQARADFPSAASDEEAFIKSVMVQQDQDQKNIDRLKSSTQRAQTLINKNDELDQTQAQAIDNIQSEIDRVEQDNNTLQQMVQRMGRANAQLQATLDKMRQRPGVAPATEPTVGVSVATDKVAEPAPAEQPAAYSPLDIGVRQKLNDLSRAVTGALLQLQTKDQTQELSAAEKERMDQLEKRMKQIEKAQSLIQNLRKKGTRQSKKAGDAAMSAIAQAMGTGKTAADVKPVEPTNIQPAPAIEPRPTSPEKVSNVLKFIPRDLAGGVADGDQQDDQSELKFYEDTKSIPSKMVIQGYTVEYDPVQRLVTVSRRGRVVGRALNKPGSYNNYQLVANRIIDASEEDKYPDDLEARSVERPFGEALAAKNQYQLMQARKAIAQRQQQPADSTPPAATQEPESQPVTLAQAQQRRDKLNQILELKKQIETLTQRAQRKPGGIERGLAADLELDFPVPQTDQDYDDTIAYYEKLVNKLNQYLARKKAVFKRKVSMENKKSDSPSRAWKQGGREGYYNRPKDNPYEKGTEEYADWNRGYDHFKDNGKEYTEALDRSGQKMYQQEEVYMLTHNGREVAFYRLKDLKQAEQDARDMQKKLGGEVHIRKVMREHGGGIGPRQHWQSLMRETEKPQPQDDILGKLFKDFGEIFGKQPAQPKPQPPKDKPVKEGNVIDVDFRQGSDEEARREYKQRRAQYFDRLAKADPATAQRLRAELQDLEDAARRKGLVREGRAGYGPLLNAKHWHEVEQHLFKIINDPNVDDQTRAEAKQRWLDKQREAKLKGFKE